MVIELLHRGRFDEVRGASARSAGANAWLVTLPLDDRAVQRSRRGTRVEGWDGAVLALDGQETEPALVSDLRDGQVTLTVWVI